MKQFYLKKKTAEARVHPPIPLCIQTNVSLVTISVRIEKVTLNRPDYINRRYQATGLFAGECYLLNIVRVVVGCVISQDDIKE